MLVVETVLSTVSRVKRGTVLLWDTPILLVH